MITDKAAGQSLDVHESETFTLEEADGEVHLKFDVDVSNLAGHTLVMFKKLMTEDNAS